MSLPTLICELTCKTSRLSDDSVLDFILCLQEVQADKEIMPIVVHEETDRIYVDAQNKFDVTVTAGYVLSADGSQSTQSQRASCSLLLSLKHSAVIDTLSLHTLDDCSILCG